MSTRVLLLGGGGREHALAWALAGSPLVDDIVCAPGNVGMATLGECLPVEATDPVAVGELADKVRPVYETLPGWGTEIETAARFEELPEAARAYVRFIEEFTHVPVSFVGVGPARDQTIVLPRAA